jgi:hypothetical protein
MYYLAFWPDPPPPFSATNCRTQCDADHSVRSAIVLR